MNSDDPKLTAYALDELDPAERAEIEQLLRENPAARAEVEETKTFVAQLRRELKEEVGAPLTEAQNAAVLAANESKGTENIVSLPALSRVHRLLLLAAAVCAIAGITSFFLINGSAQRKTASADPEPTPISTRATADAIKNGDKAMAERDYEQAATHYKLALDTGFAAANSQRESVMAKFSEACVKLAEQRLSEGRYDDAESRLKLVLDERYDPLCKKAIILLSRLEQPDYSNKTISPKFRGNFETVKQLFAEAEGFNKSGRYDLALKRTEQILNVDPYNIAARKSQEEINKAIADYGIASYDETRSRAVRNVDKAWANPIRRFDLPTDASSAPSTTKQLEVTSGTTITKSGSGTTVLSGGNVGTATGSTAMPAESPASVAAMPAPMRARPALGAQVTQSSPQTLEVARMGKNQLAASATEPSNDLFSSERRANPNPEFVLSWIEEQIRSTNKEIAALSGARKEADQVLPTEEAKNIERLKLHIVKLEEARDQGLKLVREAAKEPASTEAYDAITDNAFLAVRENPLSTFSIDVDTASYANVRRLLNQQSRPPKGAVRIEELLNYFTYDYPQPKDDAPFSATMEVATCPWTPEHRLVRIGLKGREIAKDKRPASNLVFLIDVSGSMQPENKLPLLKQCLRMLVDQLTPEDTVSIAVYAGASGTVLEPTHDRGEIRAALDRLESGGSTNGAAGIQLAYRLAEQSFIKGGVNRVILATDGDFNVGVTNQSELTDLIVRKAKSGTFLTVLGFGMGNLKDSTLEKLADKGNGNYAYIDTLNEGRKVLVEQINGTLMTIAKDVKIQVEFNPAQVGAYRLIGYENRLLAKEDFNDDKKDAGEIGAGHTVTALYEVAPAGAATPGTPAVDALKYQTAEKSEVRSQKPERSAELLTLKLRYKQPDGDTSKLLEFPLTDRGETWEKSTRDFRFAAAVASFGMLLRDSPHKGNATWESVRELAVEGRGEDRSGYRGEFLTLLDKAKALGR